MARMTTEEALRCLDLCSYRVASLGMVVAHERCRDAFGPPSQDGLVELKRPRLRVAGHVERRREVVEGPYFVPTAVQDDHLREGHCHRCGRRIDDLLVVNVVGAD